MDNKGALVVLKEAINYGEYGETRKGNWILGTDGYESIELAIAALNQQETAVAKLEIQKRKDMDLEQAIHILQKALIKDTTPGSYYYSWQSNIAMAVVDNSDVSLEQANIIAIKFLTLLTSQSK